MDVRVANVDLVEHVPLRMPLPETRLRRGDLAGNRPGVEFLARSRYIARLNPVNEGSGSP